MSELEEIAREQHEEIIYRVDRLTKAIYIASAVMAFLVLLMAGSVLFAATIMLAK